MLFLLELLPELKSSKKNSGKSSGKLGDVQSTNFVNNISGLDTSFKPVFKITPDSIDLHEKTLESVGTKLLFNMIPFVNS